MAMGSGKRPSSIGSLALTPASQTTSDNTKARKSGSAFSVSQRGMRRPTNRSEPLTGGGGAGPGGAAARPVEGDEDVAQAGGVQPADHATVVSDRDRPGFLRNDDGHCVADLADPEG